MLTSSQVLARQIADNIKLSLPIFEAFCKVDRALFVPKAFLSHAYSIDALPISASQWISSPLSVAKMTLFLDPSGADSVLEIGSGTGYQAAILSKVIRRVFSIERVEELFNQARQNLKKSSIINVNLKLDDGIHGWKAYAPYDRILFSASPKQIPQALFEQLSDGGKLVAPLEENGVQNIVVFTKRGDTITKDIKESCRFVEVLENIARNKS